MNTNNYLSRDKVKVTIAVDLWGSAADAKNVYVSGNLDELGAWDVNQAVRLKKRGNRFEATLEIAKEFPIEFKILNKKDWNGVEKGIFCEEVSNHCFHPKKVNTCIVDVNNWNSK